MDFELFCDHDNSVKSIKSMFFVFFEKLVFVFCELKHMQKSDDFVINIFLEIKI